MKKNKTQNLVLLAMFIVIEIVLSITPFGYIPLGFTKITTMHIPVILASLLLGYKEGMFLGFVFGMTSIIHNTFFPVLTSFVFSPFYGNGFSIIIALLPRILLGYIPYFLLKVFKNFRFGAFFASLLASFFHTLLVVLGIWLFFMERYHSELHYDTQQFIYFLQTIIGINGVLEAILAGIIGFCVYKTMRQVNGRKQVK